MPTEPDSPFQDKLTALAEAFADDQLQQFSKGGKNFTYPQWSECTARLNRVLGVGGWSLEILDKWRDDINKDWLLAHVLLTVHPGPGVPNEVAREAIDGQKVEVYSGGDNQGQPVDLGDSWKAAVSNAAKKAAWHLGVGLYLSRSSRALQHDEKVENTEAWEQQAKELGWNDGAHMKLRHDELSAEIRALVDKGLLTDDDGKVLKGLDYGWPMSADNYDDYLVQMQHRVEANAAQMQADQPDHASVQLGQGGDE